MKNGSEISRDIMAEDEPFAETQRVVIPVIAEELVVGKRVVETGTVRILKTVQMTEHVWEEAVQRDEVTVEHVPIGQKIECPVNVRHEGDTMIIPVMEEIFVLQKQLVLKEEIRITRRTSMARQPMSATLQHEEVEVERHPVSEAVLKNT
jgi:uncharacterized protein (TIGR02271 family)